MANITDTHVPAATGLTRAIDTVGGWFAAFGLALARMGETQARIRQVERLCELSDEQLAAKGLRREDVIRHVFRDHFQV